MHDIGVAVDYDDHHRHSYYLTLNAGLPGFTPRELVLIGLIARYHRKGEPDASDLGDLAEKGDEDRLRLLCGVIRLAEQLERSRDRAITDVSVSTDDETVTLRCSPTPSATPPSRSGRRAGTRTCWPRRWAARWRSRPSRAGSRARRAAAS